MNIRKRTVRLCSMLSCAALIAAMALVSTGCEKNTGNEAVTTAVVSEAAAEITQVGEGEKSFFLTVADANGSKTEFQVHTDNATVGGALLENGLISGDEGEFGLYIKTVNGITADYDADGTYWAFYINGEYASSGVDMTDITEGESYALKVEK